MMDAQKNINKILDTLQSIVQEEVSSLLGVEFLVTGVEKRSITKGEVFNTLNGRKICTKVLLNGAVEGSGALLIDIKDAIQLAGTLIMLPGSELDALVDGEKYSAEIEDSFGEVANIICESFSRCFEENFSRDCHFIKESQRNIVPGQVDIESDEPVRNELLYQASFSIVMDGLPMGKMVMLLPAETLDRQFDNETFPDTIKSVTSSISAQDSTEIHDGADDLDQAVDILVIGNDDIEVVKLRDVLEKRGYAVRVLSLNDNVSSFISRELKAVYLVTRNIDEQAFGMAIKVSSGCSLPIIAAAPGWTKTKVIKAVKYGVSDILLTPASAVDIEENIVNNLVKLAA